MKSGYRINPKSALLELTITLPGIRTDIAHVSETGGAPNPISTTKKRQEA
jgi:hypothetical protein